MQPTRVETLEWHLNGKNKKAISLFGVDKIPSRQYDQSWTGGGFRDSNKLHTN